MAFKGSNKEKSSKKSFVNRAKWNSRAYTEGTEGPVMSKRTNPFERHLYNLIDTRGRPVEPREDDLVSLPLDMTNGDLMSVLPFFRNQLKDLKKEIAKTKFLTVSNSNSILNNITIYRAYEPPQELYTKWLSSIVNDFINNGIKGQGNFGQRFRYYNITRFDQFVNNFLVFCELAYSNQPILYSTWYSSNKNSNYSSGLTVKISSLEYGEDEQIHNQTIGTPEFECYKAAVKKVGLAFDFQDPTVLMPDFGSPYMDNYWNSPGGHLFFYYKNVYESDLNLLYNILINLYNSYVNKQRYVIKFKDSCGKLKWDYYKLLLAPISPDMNDLSIYLKLKSVEDPSLKKKQLDDLEKRSIFLQKKFDILTSIRYINDIYLNLYYSKPYSFKDLYNKIVKERQEEERQIGTSVFGGNGGFSSY